MCYLVFVIQKRCSEKHHPQDIRVCCRQCRRRSAESYQADRWNHLCAEPDDDFLDIPIFSPGCRISDNCTVCEDMEKDFEAIRLRVQLDELMVPHKERINCMEDYQDRIRIIQNLMDEEHDRERPDRYKLRELKDDKTDLVQRTNILKVVHERRQPEIDRNNEKLKVIEDAYCDRILEDAVNNSETHLGAPPIYFGSLPDEDELRARSLQSDCPRYIPPRNSDIPIDVWGVFQAVD